MSLFDSGNRNKETRISPVSKRFTPLQQTQYHRFSQMPVHSSYLFHIQSVPSVFPVAPLCTDMHSFPSPPTLVISLRTILNGIVAPPIKYLTKKVFCFIFFNQFLILNCITNSPFWLTFLPRFIIFSIHKYCIWFLPCRCWNYIYFR